MSELINQICEQMQIGKSKAVKALCQQAMDEGLDANEVLNEGLLAGMNVVGVKFKNNEIFVPEVLVAARAMTKGIEVLKEHLAGEDESGKGTVILGTVRGDLHDIGKNLVRMMMEGKGLNVIDIGVDVAPEQFIEAAKENNADVIACSALLTTTMNEMKNVISLVESEGLKDKVKVIIGGAPITQAFADQIGADGYTPDATSAAEMALAFCQK